MKASGACHLLFVSTGTAPEIPLCLKSYLKSIFEIPSSPAGSLKTPASCESQTIYFSRCNRNLFSKLFSKTSLRCLGTQRHSNGSIGDTVHFMMVPSRLFGLPYALGSSAAPTISVIVVLTSSKQPNQQFCSLHWQVLL